MCGFCAAAHGKVPLVPHVPRIVAGSFQTAAQLAFELSWLLSKNVIGFVRVRCCSSALLESRRRTASVGNLSEFFVRQITGRRRSSGREPAKASSRLVSARL